MALARSHTPLLPALGRIFWMLAGPMALAVLAVAIVQLGNGWLTPIDFAFLVVLAALPLARWLEFQGGDARTTTGEPAAPSELGRYAVVALALGLVAWVVANLLGNHWLSG